MQDYNITTGAVCVYPNQVKSAVKWLKAAGVDLPVASVATGFPAGQTPLRLRLEEIREAVGDGAREIDIVINRTYVSNLNIHTLLISNPGSSRQLEGHL